MGETNYTGTKTLLSNAIEKDLRQFTVVQNIVIDSALCKVAWF